MDFGVCWIPSDLGSATMTRAVTKNILQQFVSDEMMSMICQQLHKQ